MARVRYFAAAADFAGRAEEERGEGRVSELRAALGQAQPPMPFQAASPSSVHCFFHTGRPRLISSMRVRQI